ncbi:NADPH:quinone reductase [Parafrankia colletiae]|uniref:NADPH:quinone reductase n=1 Tax=Parafrankia colletiae TaxID=573497 RepID=A0A1S1QD00_9ACTN|nr:NADP-dependent oxidoreductase [Parafrankia colletiae]MCK9902528.1 NADP-dependent oxidoreductase [Frankia sp. Cpl3]OHV31486.1 NADPH:quinone reductase [Parafrankia colletiae]
MRAIRIHEYGDASVIRYEDVPRPVPGLGEVLIRVAATSFNPSEIGLRSGLLRSTFPLELPHTLGWDVAGTVVEVGSNVRTFTVHDRVIGLLDSGAAAEYAVAAADALVLAPTSSPLTHAAAIPVAGLTAWQAVFEHAHVTAGQRVLVNGAGGGVGGFAVQFAKHAGAHVLATASPRSAVAVGRLGADQIIDYTASPVADHLDERIDTVLNLAAITPQQADALVPLLRPGGMFVSITTPIEPPTSIPVTARNFVARNDTSQLAALVTLVDTGVVHIDIAASRPLADLAAVHRDAESNRTRGKIIIVP